MTRMTRMVCVGGPSNGLWMDVPDDRPYFRVRDPLAAKPWRKFEDGLPIEADLYAQFGPIIRRDISFSTYRIASIHTPDRTEHRYLAIEGMDAPEQIRLLLEGYNP